MENSGIQLLYADGLDRHKLTLKTNIVYAERPKGSLHMQLICHEFKRMGERLPAVVFINASGWMRPDSFSELPQLAELAKRGYVIASIEYRGTDREHYTADGARFPDHIVDTKAAIRFLRAHAEEYGIDAEHIAVFGWATGGHTALMTALTNENPELEPAEYPEFSSAVQAVISIDSETDLPHISQDRLDSGIFSKRDFLENDYPIELLRLFGADQTLYEEQQVKASPIFYVTEENKIPAMLLFNGDRNNVVPFRQASRLYERMRACGKVCELYRLAGAAFLKGVWTPELIRTAADFLDIYLPLSTERNPFMAAK